MAIDYESMYMYPLTEDTLRQICSVNTFKETAVGMASYRVNNLQSITGESEYSGLGHSRLVQTRKFYKGLFPLEVTR
jgi:hypothetical protein